MRSRLILWRLWSVDYFDRDSEPGLEAEGEDLLAGLELLWRRVLEESVLDDGRPAFTWFDLQYDGGWARIPRDPLTNPELGRLRGWRALGALIPALARAHLERVDSAGAAWILAAAREAANDKEFLERIG